MEQEQAAWFQNLLGAVHKKLVITASHMLCHSHAHHPVERPVHLWQIPVIHERNFQKIFQILLPDPAFKFFVLLMAERDPHAVNAVFFRRLDKKKSPAAANVEKGHSLGQMQLFQNVIHFVDLRLVQAVVLMKKIAAGIAHRLVQPQLVKVISYIVVALDLLLLVLFPCR